MMSTFHKHKLMELLLYILTVVYGIPWCVNADLEVGIIHKETLYGEPKILTVDKCGMKSCARRCLYHKACFAFNYHTGTLVCDLLKSVGTSHHSSVSETIASDISTWTLANDVCYPNPCQENEECTQTENKYFCRQDTSFCKVERCLNGGTCSSELLSFECRCADGFTGEFCQFSACDSDPCNNNGTCEAMSDPPGYTCSCTKGYHGRDCEHTPCYFTPCKNNGTCTINGGSFTCTCTDVYSGTTCDESICDTMRSPCGMYGYCKPLSRTSYICVCDVGYYGDHCQLTPCSSNPCLNNGTCTLTNTSYLCSCPSPYYGSYCQSVSCSTATCIHGKCHKRGGCICNNGYTGIMCDRRQI